MDVPLFGTSLTEALDLGPHWFAADNNRDDEYDDQQ